MTTLSTLELLILDSDYFAISMSTGQVHALPRVSVRKETMLVFNNANHVAIVRVKMFIYSDKM
jgi:hypothetical protein